MPDSLLKNICAYISDNTTPNEHLITANEGSAVALAVGQYMQVVNHPWCICKTLDLEML